jgi:hypothetical protein
MTPGAGTRGAAGLISAGRHNEFAAQSRISATRGLAQDVCPCIDRQLLIVHAMSIGLSVTNRQPRHRQPVSPRRNVTDLLTQMGRGEPGNLQRLNPARLPRRDSFVAYDFFGIGSIGAKMNIGQTCYTAMDGSRSSG